MADSGRPLFSIGAVARMLDVAPATIRTWESRYRFVVPQRSAGGQRLYSRDQVEQLRFVAEEVTGGRRPAEAHRLLAEHVAAGRAFTARTLRVLLAESEFGAVEVLRRLLGADGFEVVLASDPQSAARKLEELEPAVAVVDTDDVGYDHLLRRLRELGTTVVPASGLLARAR